jgi:hypothetical protein
MHARASRMPCRKLSPVVLGFPVLVFLWGCSAKLECDSIETRTAVLQLVSNDTRNPLANYAANNSTESKDSNSETVKPPRYLLGEKIVTTSTGKDKRTLECSGPISVIYGDIKATKEVNFTVQQASDGKLSVSVAPFQF